MSGRAPAVRILAWVKSSDANRRTGLLGYLTLQYGELVLDSVTLRWTEAGRYALNFPAKRDRVGRQHAYYRPADGPARRRIEDAVFGELSGFMEEGS